MDAELCETGVSVRRLETLLLAALAKGKNGKVCPLNGLRLVAVDSHPTSVQGYLSTILRIKLTWNRANKDTDSAIPQSVIAKYPTSDRLQAIYDENYGTDVVDATPQMRNFHNDECAAYRILEILYSDQGSIDIPVPRHLSSVTVENKGPIRDGILILEDLGPVGEVKHSIAEKLNQHQIEQLVDVLAELHSRSYIFQHSHGHCDEWENLPAFDDRLQTWSSWFCLNTDIFNSLKDQYPATFSDVPEEKIMQACSEKTFLKIFGIGAHKDELPVVLVHGDMQPLNFLFSNEDENRLVGLIDWQLCHRGCGVEDLARLMVLCSTNAFKRKYQDVILRRYVHGFNQKIEHASLPPISFEKVKSIFTEMYAVMAIAFACSVRVVDQLVLAIEEEKRDRVKKMYVDHCHDLCRDAVEIFNW